MNETLSTLIAFVGVLIVLSMLVQSVQEAMKRFFTMKAGVWESFWRSVYKNELGLLSGASVPEAKAGFRAKLRSTWGILPRPLQKIVLVLLGPIWRPIYAVWRSSVGRLDVRMDQLKKNLVTVTGALGQAKTELGQAMPDPGRASPDDWKKAKPQLEATLKKVADLKLGTILNIYKSVDASEVIPKLESALTTIFGDPTGAGADEAAFVRLTDAITNAETKLLAFKPRLEQQFDAWMARVESTYRNHMLLITVLIGTVVVSVVNADAFSMYRALSASPKARDAVIAQVQEVTKQTLSSKAEDLNAIHASIQANNFDNAKTKAKELGGKLAEDFKTYEDEGTAKKAIDIKDAIDAITPSGEGLAALIAKEGELTSLFVKLNRTAVETHAGAVAGLELPLGWSREKKAFAGATVTSPIVLHKIAGLLLTIFLITFGAPFWNDILGVLTGVKNTLGKKNARL
jgi:hypothetical protein